MLRLHQQSSPDAAKSYYASVDYYTEGQELVGAWGGKGAERLGLDGPVGKQAFNSLCDNRDPVSGQQLTPRSRSDRTVGYDFTFDGPTSVSVLYALTGDERILDVFRASVAETMAELEGAMQTRVRSKGRNENRHADNMVWAEFVHFTARPVDGIPDPQLHSHCFAFNTTWDAEETRWKAGNFQDINREMPYYQAAFHARLARRLVDLGYGVERHGHDWEVAGVPESVREKFSRRDAQIEAEAERRGITDPASKAELAAKTREGMNKNLTWDQLKAHWREQLTDGEAHALATAAREGKAAIRLQPVLTPGAAVDHSILHGFERNAVLSEKDLLAEALRHGVGDVSVEAVHRERQHRPLIVQELEGRRLATTRQMVNDEARLISFARERRGRFRTLGDPQRSFNRAWLNDGQKAAVRHVLGSRDRVSVIRGVAGTGKTTLEQELGEALREAGRTIVALAPTAEASRGVLREEAGFAGAETVARFLVDKALQQEARGGVVLVDEASLLGTRDMARLFAVAGEIDARVILVGDRRQHRSVSAGEPLRLLEERAGLPVAEVTEIQRQGGEYKQAVRLLSEGRAAAAFKLLEASGCVREVADRDRYRELAGDYVAAASERRRDGGKKTALVVSPTHAEGERITSAIRHALQEKGLLRNERELPIWLPAHLTLAERSDARHYRPGDMLHFHQNAPGHTRGEQVMVSGAPLPLELADRFAVYRPDSLQVAAGDRIRITANGKTRDGRHRLDNGSLITVKGFTREGDLIDDRGWVIGQDFGHLAHGYVVTSHASQGKSVDRVLVGQSATSLPASNLAQFYVSVSRRKEDVTIYTDNKQALLAAVRRSDNRPSATELAENHGGAERRRHLTRQRRWRLVDRERFRSLAAPERQVREVNHER